ncbi:MAG: DNA mismatch repair endonuclease MutL [Chloroflexi bacterium]|nr:DNA mismatch repair endonuclease MutL [Chloroflexota bacterium]
MPIRILPEPIVAQIAAGEVVERPAAVVKELIENAIDAGATTIKVAVQGDGRRSIQISDDGCGIPVNEVETAFARHATSKLATIDDLYRIETLGFRGEALASIASVSHLTMTTRHANDAAGALLHLEAGQITQQQPVGAPAGTVIAVENLFFNTPARLKFLKKETTEKRQIATVVTRYAMAYPQVRFTLEQDGRELFRTLGTGSLIDVVAAAIGLDHTKHMLEVDDPQEDIAVYGFTSAPSLSRADRTRITLFVNGRWIQDTSLTYAVVQAYHTLLMTGRYPIAVLMIQMPPAEVDVNVHPTKAEVRFRQPDKVFAAVQRAVRRAVIDQAQTPTLRRGRHDPSHSHSADWYRTERTKQMTLDMHMDDPGRHTQQYARPAEADTSARGTTDPTAIPAGPQAPAQPRTLPMLRVIGQVSASYIIAEGPAGLYLIDQHAAHERILYEQFMSAYHQQETISQYTLAAQTIQVAPHEAQLIEERLTLLSSFGFTLEPFGPNIFVIRSVPAMLADSDPLEVIAGVIDDLEHGHTPGQASIEDKIILRVCKQAAVKAGQVLNYDQMQSLIRQLERCQSPLSCPHGRPTLLHMSSDQLAREFGRI